MAQDKANALEEGHPRTPSPPRELLPAVPQQWPQEERESKLLLPMKGSCIFTRSSRVRHPTFFQEGKSKSKINKSRDGLFQHNADPCHVSAGFYILWTQLCRVTCGGCFVGAHTLCCLERSCQLQQCVSAAMSRGRLNPCPPRCPLLRWGQVLQTTSLRTVLHPASLESEGGNCGSTISRARHLQQHQGRAPIAAPLSDRAFSTGAWARVPSLPPCTARQHATAIYRAS